jgi:opacity protein-like surface antigen
MEAETNMKLRTISMATVAALSLFAGRADAQDAQAAQVAQPAQSTTDAGWNTKYGILFTLPNLFQNGSSAVIGEYASGPSTADRVAGAPLSGRIGAQYNFDSAHGLRLTLALGRFSEGINETTNSITGVTTKTPPLVTSALSAEVGAQYMIRLTQTAVAPYLGAGAKVGYANAKREGKYETSAVPGAFLQYDDATTALDFGINGTLGLEWRIHKVISLFAEYQADLTVISTYKDKNSTRDQVGPLVNNETKETAYANLGTGLAQSGRLGILAFF